MSICERRDDILIKYRQMWIHLEKLQILNLDYISRVHKIYKNDIRKNESVAKNAREMHI